MAWVAGLGHTVPAERRRQSSRAPTVEHEIPGHRIRTGSSLPARRVEKCEYQTDANAVLTQRNHTSETVAVLLRQDHTRSLTPELTDTRFRTPSNRGILSVGSGGRVNLEKHRDRTQYVRRLAVI